MDYGIFQGVSVLRSLSNDERDLLRPSHYGIKDPSFFDHIENSNKKSKARLLASFYRAAAVLLLLGENPGAAHEVVLGVTPEPEAIEAAEYAATHPGQTSWAADHPWSFSASSDLLHSALHRLEGPLLGEGNHTGYENAKYWATGGPRSLESPEWKHPVRKILKERAKRVAPLCVARGVLTFGPKEHRVIAGGGKTRRVVVGRGMPRSKHGGDVVVGDDGANACLNNNNDDKDCVWDDLVFIDLCRLRQEGNLTEKESEEVADLQQTELVSLLQIELGIFLEACLNAGLGKSKKISDGGCGGSGR